MGTIPLPLSPSLIPIHTPGALYDLKRGFFACHDRSDVIDVMHFNDDYCDCADGSDEPGTSQQR